MPAYITLFNWTEQGIKNVRETTKRAKAVREMWEAAGGQVIGIWWTQGQYDGVLIHETQTLRQLPGCLCLWECKAMFEPQP
jgi:uncharacterized protein with GYD domain